MNKLTADELREMYLSFFESKGHKRIPGASVIPENDPTVLFTTAGMHPLVPYLMGAMEHPAGTRLTDVQKCIRTGDIDAVGDSAHLTFFEMLGNWSLNDYFKKEAISWSYEFLTTKLGFSPDQLSVTVFKGEGVEGESGYIPADEEAVEIWKSLGIPDERIYRLPREDNWWGPAGTTGPCGPDTEMFIDTGKEKCGPDCRPGCHCGKFIEIWNDVFMQYNKNADGAFEPLGRHNVDTGMGVERTICMMSGAATVYDTEIFAPIMAKIDELSTVTPEDAELALKSRRIVADHMRTATFILCDPKGGVKPGNIGANYVLRRLIRRAVRYSRFLGIAPGFTVKLAEVICEKYKHVYPELAENLATCKSDLEAEENRFNQTLDKGAAMFAKVAEQLKAHNQTQISGKTAFKLYDTFGYPLEMTLELAKEQGLEVDVAGFEEANRKHQELSRTTSAGSFKAGLQDNSEVVTRMHTATHLLHAALHKVLGPTANQKGSNITAERLRFDFTWPEKMTDAQIAEVEKLVNGWIEQGIDVTKKLTTVEEAKAEGAVALFGAKYGEQVSLYSIGEVSKEICCGPHVENTKELGSFKIQKEQSSSAGVRRIKAVIGNM
ncbi:MAG: alanine--tRNA ligase [Kiritimatiellae bacterium]|nr:alanine--tRNA ligase [Kiritimatiellia bacterium]MBR6588085.1 alanine--tRNA ligase [Kiritimatiellia bacterium]